MLLIFIMFKSILTVSGLNIEIKQTTLKHFWKRYGYIFTESEKLLNIIELKETPPCVSSEKYTTICPVSTVYSYDMTSCDRTCRSLGQSDSTCAIAFVPVDGCGCADGTFMNENGDCVASVNCSCYDSGKTISPGDVISKDGRTWWVDGDFTIILKSISVFTELITITLLTGDLKSRTFSLLSAIRIWNDIVVLIILPHNVKITD